MHVDCDRNCDIQVIYFTELLIAVYGRLSTQMIFQAFTEI